MLACIVNKSPARIPYYGWLITAALAITETISWGAIYYAFSVFVVPMQTELGWSNAVLTGGFSLALLISGIAAPLVGRWLDRRGPRAIMTAGSIAGALLLLAWSRVSSVVGFYLIWAGFGLVMSANLYEPAFATLTTWFERKRARAVLIVTIAAGFASTIFLPLAARLVDRFGWRDALVILAVIVAAFNIPLHALVLRRRPEDMGLAPDGLPITSTYRSSAPLLIHGLDLRDALHDRAFWWLAIAFSLETFSMVAIGVHLIPYLTERGDSAAFAASVAGLIGAAQVLARIVATVFGNRVTEITLTGMLFVLQAVALVLLMEWRSTTGLIVSVLVLGAGRGVVTLMRPSLIAQFYGRAHFGSINGTLSLFLTGSRALAPVGAGAAYVLLDGYTPVLWGMATLSALAALAMIQVNRHRMTRRQA